MKIHCCIFDRECREFGAPKRIMFTTDRHHLTLALSPNSRLQKVGTHWSEGRSAWVRLDRRPTAAENDASRRRLELYERARQKERETE